MQDCQQDYVELCALIYRILQNLVMFFTGFYIFIYDKLETNITCYMLYNSIALHNHRLCSYIDILLCDVSGNTECPGITGYCILYKGNGTPPLFFQC